MADGTFLYHMAVAKPKAAAVWLPMRNGSGILIIRKNAEAVKRIATTSMPAYLKTMPDNNFQSVDDWEVAAARVTLV